MKRITTVLVAATAIGGMTLAGGVKATGDTSPQAPQSTPMAQASNADMQTAPDAKEIDRTVALLTKDALTTGNFDHLLNRFTEADQKRISDSPTFHDNYGKNLDAVIGKISADWKVKYGHDLDVKVKDAAQLYNADFASIEEAQAGGNPQLATKVTKNSASQSEVLKPDEKIAVVTVKPAHVWSIFSSFDVPMVYESGAWRINVPAKEDAVTLRQNLLAQLSSFANHSADWPKDENAALRMASRHVLIAVLGQGS